MDIDLEDCLRAHFDDRDCYAALKRSLATEHRDEPGLDVLARRGAGPLDGDLQLPGGLWQTSRARALAENMRSSRSRGGRPRRTLDDHEIDAWIERLCRLEGEKRPTEYRRHAEQLGPQPGVDPDRIERFDALIVALRSAAPSSRHGLAPDSTAFSVQAFWEAYFSNSIEGATFTVDEAKSIIFDGALVANRMADSHDIPTYAIVADPDEMSRTAANPHEFIDLLRARHATLRGGRPQIAGVFKTLANQAGMTLFVDPALVDGTLREGWRRLAELDTAWERAVYTMFLVSEVHRFTDGNGRIARVMMNAELVARHQSKIVVPTGFRGDCPAHCAASAATTIRASTSRRCASSTTAPPRSTGPTHAVERARNRGGCRRHE